ncbi:MAG: HYR domain-containing protein [Lewinellaceae bacterium]|nr:HYR domain-containing protein [Lewinellaceae bacterium]
MTCPNDVTICTNNLPYTLSDGMPMGGVFSGTGVIGNLFNVPPPVIQSFFDVFYTVTDPVTLCENTCSFEITVNPLPVVTCPNDVTICADDLAYTLSDGMPMGGVFSGTGVIGNLFNVPPPVIQSFFDVFYTVTDPVTLCENTCSFEITVNPLPVVTCPPNMTICVDQLPFTLNEGTPTGGVFSGMHVTGDQFDPPPPVIQSFFDVFYTVTDPVTLCADACSFQITVNPQPNAGTISGAMTLCPGGSTTLGTDGDAGGIWDSSDDNIATVDNMGNVSATGTGMVTISYTVAALGCTSTASKVITIGDAVPPTAACQNTITINLDGSGNATLSPIAVDNGSSDNCGTPSLSVNPNTFTCTSFTPAATDLFISEYVEGSGSEKYVEIFNPTAGTVNLGNYRLRLYSNGAGTPTNDVLLSGSLASGATMVYKNSSASGPGTSNAAVNFNGDDALTLFNVGTNANVDIFGRIGEDPGTAWTGGGNTTLDKTLRRKPTVLQGVTTNPGGGFPTLATEWNQFNIDVISGLGAHKMAHLVTLTATDGSGLQSTCAAVVTVQDNTAPTLTCPSSQVVTTSSNGTGDCTGSYTIADPVADNCTATWGYSATGVTTIAAVTGLADGVNSPALAFNKGISTVVLTATDDSGNAATTCSFTVTVNDNEVPMLACPVNQNLNTAANVCTANYTIVDPVTDNCTGSTWSYAASGETIISTTTRNDGQNSVAIVFNAGMTTVTLNATDAASNAAVSCSFTVTVNDGQAPTALCQSAAVVLDGMGNATLDAADVNNNNSTDNCGSVTVSVSPNMFGCADAIPPTATDLFFSEYVEGSSSNKYIEVYNPTASAINLANYELHLYANGSGSATTTNILSGMLPAGATVVFKNSAATVYLGASTTQSAVNWNGNDAIALFNTVSNQFVDIFGRIGENPGTAWTGGGNSTLDKTLRRKPTVFQGITTNPGGGFPALATEWDQFNIDVVAGLGSHTFTPLATATVTLTVEDGAGLTSTCTATVTIQDATAPTLTCPTDQIITTSSNGTGDCAGGYTILDPVADNCTATWGYSATGVTTIAAVTGVANGANSPGLAFNKGVSTVVLTAVDGSGNAATTCSFTVTVNDNEAPTITCPTPAPFNTAFAACTAVVNFTAPVGTDNCPGAMTTQTDMTGLSTGSAFPKGTTVLEYTVTDAANLTSSCSFSVTVIDNQPPTITCPAGSPFARNTDPIQCNYTVLGAEFDPTTFGDNCPGATITNDLNNSNTLADEDLPKGPTTIIWTVTDGMGMSSATCAITVNVTDNQPPTITCPTGSPFDRNTDAGQCNYTVQGTEFNPTFTNDNCPGVFLTNSFNGNASLDTHDLPKGSTTITWTLTESMSGVTSTCSITVIVTDNQPPTITCPAGSPFARNTDAGQCNYTVQDAEFDPTFGDNCPGATISNNFNNTNTLANADLPKGLTTITWTVTDGMGMSSTTCEIVVNVTDNQPPVVTCPADQTVTTSSNGTGDCTGAYTIADPLSDNCPGATWGYSASGATTIAAVTGIADGAGSGALPFDLGVSTVQLSAVDMSGNPAVTCTFTVTLQDNEAPGITVGCPGAQTIHLNSSCEATMPNYIPGLTLSDNCSMPGNILVTQSPVASSTISGPTPVTVTLTPQDEAGNDGTPCTFTITGQAPDINLQGNGVDIVSGDITPDLGDHTDFGGTNLGVTVERIYTIQNTGTEVLFLGGLSRSNTTDFVFSGAPSSSINPGDASTFRITFLALTTGTKTSTVSIVTNDYCGNENPYTFEIQASVDCIPPVITTCPGAQNVPAASGQCNAVTTYTPVATGTPTPTWSYQFSGATSGSGNGTGSSSTFNVGMTTVVLTATNSCGTTSCSFVVTVNDTQLPTITCPNPTTVSCAGNVPAPNTASVSASDNCSVTNKEHLFSTPFNIVCANRFSVLRVYRATDASNNSATCSQIITVFDNTQPNFTFVPANVTVQCNSVPAVGTPSASDGCGGSVSISYNGQTVSNILCMDKYTLTRQWTATDACGNMRTAMQKITVTDTQKPAFVSVPANVTVQCDAIPPLTMPTATDNCAAEVTITYIGETRTNGTCLNRYTLTRRWSAADNCGNAAMSVSQRITVVDNGKPTLTVPADMTIACNSPLPAVGTATASDGCAGAVTLLYLGQTTANSQCPGTYQIKRTWRATDVCGNSTAATQTIQVSDTGAPVFVTVPGPVTIECNQPIPPLVNPTASDACGGYVHITFLGNVASGSGCTTYTITRTWRADDLCGNTATTTQLITVLGNNFVQPARSGCCSGNVHRQRAQCERGGGEAGGVGGVTRALKPRRGRSIAERDKIGTRMPRMLRSADLREKNPLKSALRSIRGIRVPMCVAYAGVVAKRVVLVE